MEELVGVSYLISEQYEIVLVSKGYKKPEFFCSTILFLYP